MDETDVKVRREWKYLYRVVDPDGKAIDLSRIVLPRFAEHPINRTDKLILSNFYVDQIAYNRKLREMSNAIPLRNPGVQKIPDLLQLKIELAWIKPSIWRRIVVPESITLCNLHQVLQIAFDWRDVHLHEFDFGRERFDIPDPEVDRKSVRSETCIQLKTALGRMTSFKYIYDFGDHWEHRVKVEKRLPGEPELSHRAMLLKAANASPPENVGGAAGYEEFVAVMADPTHPEYPSMREWYGDSFDPLLVDVIAINIALHNLKI